MRTRAAFAWQALTRRQRTCPWCGSATLLTRGRKAAGLVALRQCVDCALLHTSPMYVPAQSAAFYDVCYDQHEVVAVPDADTLATLKAGAFRGHPRDAWPLLAALRAQFAGTALPTLLDFGCSWGYLLFQAQAAGFLASGVESARTRGDFARHRLGATVCAGLAELPETARFDVVHCAHTLEHLSDLRVQWPALLARVAPGGWLLVEVPDVDPVRNPDWASLLGAVHPLGLNRRFLSGALAASGWSDATFGSSWAGFPQLAEGPGGTLCMWARAPRT